MIVVRVLLTSSARRMEGADGSFPMMAAAAGGASPVAPRQHLRLVPEHESASFSTHGTAGSSSTSSSLWEHSNAAGWDPSWPSHSIGERLAQPPAEAPGGFMRRSDAGLGDSRRHGSSDALHILRSSESFSFGQTAPWPNDRLYHAPSRSMSAGSDVYMLGCHNKRKPDAESMCVARELAVCSSGMRLMTPGSALCPGRVGDRMRVSWVIYCGWGGHNALTMATGVRGAEPLRGTQLCAKRPPLRAGMSWRERRSRSG